MDSPRVPALVRRLCDSSETPSARDRAASGLAAAGEPAVDPLCLCLEDRDSSARGRAADVLGAIGDRRAVPYLLAALDDADWAVRLSVAMALGRLRDDAAVEPLCRALGDPVWSVGAAAAGALKDMRDLRSLRSLLDTAREGHSMLRRPATRAVEAFGPIADLATRVVADDRMKPGDRRETLAALRSFRSPGARAPGGPPLPPVDEFCRQSLTHQDAAVRTGARRILDSGRLLRPAAPGADVLLRPAPGVVTKDTGSLLRPTNDPEEEDPR